MGHPALLPLCLTVLAAPLVGFVLQYAFGKRLPGQGAWMTVGAIGVSLGCSLFILWDVLSWTTLKTIQFGPWEWLDFGAEGS